MRKHISSRKITRSEKPANEPTYLCGKITLFVVAASNLKSVDSNGFSDPYVKVMHGMPNWKCIFKTSIKKKTLEPTWFSEMITFDIPDFDIRLEVMDYNNFTGDKDLGYVQLDLKKMFSEGRLEIDDWYDISGGGRLHLKLSLDVTGTIAESDIPVPLAYNPPSRRGSLSQLGGIVKKSESKGQINNLKSSESRQSMSALRSSDSRHQISGLSKRLDDEKSSTSLNEEGNRSPRSPGSMSGRRIFSKGGIGRLANHDGNASAPILPTAFAEGRPIYIPPSGTVTIQILGAVELTAVDSNGLSDPYVKVYRDIGKSVYKSSIKRKTLEPVWNSESISFEIPHYEVKFIIKDYNTFSGDKDLGYVKLNLEELFIESTEFDKWFNVLGGTGKLHLKGTLQKGQSLPRNESKSSISSLSQRPPSRKIK